MRSLYPEMYSEQVETNRILDADDHTRTLELAVQEPVLQTYPPNKLRARTEQPRRQFGCRVDFRAPSFDESQRLADVLLEALEPDGRRPSAFGDSYSEFLAGTRNGGIAVFFTLTMRRTAPGG